jgi:hypothetical protein
MDNNRSAIKNFLDALGLDEELIGVFYTKDKNFSCVMSKVWLARKKSTAAYFDQERFGCYGGAFYLGFIKPHLKRSAYVISTGIPDIFDGERFIESPEFAVPFELFQRMLGRWEESFMKEKLWATVRKKIKKSRKTWGEENNKIQ